MRAVIFDVDGTLAETERDGHRPAFNQAFTDLGLPYRWGAEEYGQLLAITGGQRRLRTYLVQRGHGGDSAGSVDDLAERLHRAKTGHFLDWVNHAAVEPRPGVHALLRGLAELGCQLAVATTGSRAWVEPLLARALPDIRFDPVVTGNDVRRLKPEPDAYLQALDRLQISAKDAVAVEDSLPGALAARASGLACLVVPSAYTNGSRFPPGTVVVPDFTAIDAAGLAALLGDQTRPGSPSPGPARARG